MLFRSKPTLFSSFTIDLGPLYVERVLDGLLTLSGITGVKRMKETERYEKSLLYLKRLIPDCSRNQYTFIQFYLGYYNQQLAKETVVPNHTRHYQEKALCHYQNFLDLPPLADESRFYAQWQSGMLQEELGYPWEMASASLLGACDIDPLRGESLQQIVMHYTQARDWRSAYEYSLQSMEKHFDRNPIAARRWFVNFKAYDWNLLNTHLKICYKLGYSKEAGTVYKRMVDYERKHLAEFANLDIRRIHSLEKLFHRSQPVLATA